MADNQGEQTGKQVAGGKPSGKAGPVAAAPKPVAGISQSTEPGSVASKTQGDLKKVGTVAEESTGQQNQPQQTTVGTQLQETPIEPAKQKEKIAEPESEDDEEDDKKVLEESPCGRFVKTAAQVKQRDVPGIDVAYLAMDNETGQEVVWNEVQFSERKNFRAQEDKLKAVFANLTQLQHPNLVKFHKYWTDTEPQSKERPRIVFITEFMSSGSMSQFLKRTKKGNTSLSEKSWKKWCVQILSALSYLHSCEPQIVHGNLSCNTIFIQQNGLIKIGCVAPNSIHHHVKTVRDNLKNLHYIAPEYEVGGTSVTGAADIYAFGICALEMAVLGFSTNGDGGQVVTSNLINKTLESVENPMMKDFIQKCLYQDPAKRPTSRELLYHTVLYSVHSLKLIAAHRLITAKTYDALNMDDFRIKDRHKDTVIAEIKVMGGQGPITLKYSNVNIIEELDKFVEDVNNGIYPLYAFELPKKNPVPTGNGTLKMESAGSGARVDGERSNSPEVSGPAGTGGGTTGPKESEKDWDPESRRIIRMSADLRAPDGGGEGALLKLMLKLDDQMNRELTTQIKPDEEPLTLADDLVDYGFISEVDKDAISNLLTETMKTYFLQAQQQINSAPNVAQAT